MCVRCQTDDFEGRYIESLNGVLCFNCLDELGMEKELQPIICPECDKKSLDYPLKLHISYRDGSMSSTNDGDEPLCLSCLAIEIHGSYQAHKSGIR